jgi:adenylate cyclase
MPNYLLQNPDDARAKLFHAVLLLEDGQRERAIAEADDALAMAPNDSLMLYNLACLYAQLGDKPKAIATLKEAVAAGVTNYQWWKHDPDLDSLHDDPEFQALARGDAPSA